MGFLQTIRILETYQNGGIELFSFLDVACHRIVIFNPH